MADEKGSCCFQITWRQAPRKWCPEDEAKSIFISRDVFWTEGCQALVALGTVHASVCTRITLSGVPNHSEDVIPGQGMRAGWPGGAARGGFLFGLIPGPQGDVWRSSRWTSCALPGAPAGATCRLARRFPIFSHCWQNRRATGPARTGVRVRPCPWPGAWGRSAG